MKDYRRDHPEFSLCGLNCLLCPMHVGSYCPGCGGGEGHQSCAMIRCSLERREVEFCFQCGQFPCGRHEKAMEYDSFISHRNMLRDLARAKKMGVEAYLARQEGKAAILNRLLEHYNDGRRKSFFCNAVNLLELEDLKQMLAQLEEERSSYQSVRERAAQAARLLQQLGEQREIPLQLNKKPKKPKKIGEGL